LPGYSENTAYYDRLFQHFHGGAFNKAYSMGGRRRGASFDADQYLAVLLARMSAQAKRDGKGDVVMALDLARGVHPFGDLEEESEGRRGRSGPPGS
ncbi:MAG: hypothetical protein AAF488_15240, partial [Planctomycetota bacterium]